jgi:predicted enzyme related to lactoylglutathione lyase
MSATPSKFVWYELATPDPAASEAFYGAVAGWSFQHMGGGDMVYTIIQTGAVGVGGMAKPPPGAGLAPAWIGYIYSDDVDAAAKQVAADGGKVVYGPDDIPTVGRFARCQDPQGAAFILFDPIPPDGPVPPTPPMGAPGYFGWRELATSDLQAGFDFYARQFGWTKAQAFEMGPMGTYQLYAAGDENLGGMMKHPDPSAPPAWLYYIQVDSAKAAVERVTAAGGKVMRPPQQVPSGAWVFQALDPHGAAFGISSDQP